MQIRAFHEAIPGYLDDKGDTLQLRLSVKTEESLTVYVRVEPDNEEFLFEMSGPMLDADGWSSYRINVNKATHTVQTRYLFKLVSAEDSIWYGATGLTSHVPQTTQMFRYAHDRRLPMWSADQVFYQVFPERFANGDTSLSPVDGEYRYLGQKDIVAKEWSDEPVREQAGFEFFGGDLIGVRDKLTYLNDELGVTALYLNPVFESRSNHKYDTTDYFNVDSHFGGNEALSELVKDIHSRDMKIVLDAVINHTSVMHPWFQSALQGSEVDKARYTIENEDQYASWKGHKSLPVLDFSNELVVQDMITSDSSVIRHWLREPYKIDGWRMDVIHMLGDETGALNNDKHLRTLRETIKEENDQALLLGEHFFEATPWLQGDQEDCAMNYFGFAHPARAFFANTDIALHPVKISGEEFAHWLREARSRISFSHQLLQFNQLDSHDTPRFLTMLCDDEAMMQVAIGFLMTYIGTPCLYYGTEIGMTGDNDINCRRGFPWNTSDWNHTIFEQTKRWVEIRKSYGCLSQGALIDVFADQDVVVFVRVIEQQQALVIVNRGDEKRIGFEFDIPSDGSKWTSVEGVDSLEMMGSRYSLTVPAKSIHLWVR